MVGGPVVTAPYAHDALAAPETLSWKKSTTGYGGYTAQRGDLMFWSRSKYSEAFAEGDRCYVSFKASRKRTGKGWELRIWTYSFTECHVVELDTLAQCKAAAPLFAAALAYRYDGGFPSDRYLVDSLLRSTEGGVNIWVTYPEQRDDWGVKRLAENHVEVSL